MVKIKIVNRGSQQLPAYATPQSAGMDLRANITEPITLQPMERRIIPTGLHIALPEGYEAQSANFLIKGLCPKCSFKESKK